MTKYSECVKRADQELLEFLNSYMEDIIKYTFNPRNDSNFDLREREKESKHGNIALEEGEEGLYLFENENEGDYVAQYYSCFLSSSDIFGPRYNHRFLPLESLIHYFKTNESIDYRKIYPERIEEITWEQDIMEENSWGGIGSNFFLYKGDGKKEITLSFINWTNENPLEVKE